MRCPRCHSKNLIKIGHLIYCRDCISFGQVRFNQTKPQYPKKNEVDHVYYDLSYDLSSRQKELASQVILAIEKKQHVLIQAVCGSGKTEILYPFLCYALNQQLRVGFACPRKDLAIELYQRLSQQLKNVDMCLVYGGHHEELYASLVVLTCHQLYRYWNYFDVLIIDEVDAFPFYGNHALYKMAAISNKGSFILLSATAFENPLPFGFVKLSLDRRYHNHDLPVPRLMRMPDGFALGYIYLKVKKIISRQGLVMIFVPKKKDLIYLGNFLKMVQLPFKAVSSSTLNNTQTLQAFREHRFQVLLTTTLLERGVTFENVHVFVFHAHHSVFNRSTLIQIAGRVGRKPSYPNGLVVFIGKRKTKEMKECRSHILSKNAPYAGNT